MANVAELKARKLGICATCEHYGEAGGKPTCAKMKRPTRLHGLINLGRNCPEGKHDQLDPKPPAEPSRPAVREDRDRLIGPWLWFDTLTTDTRIFADSLGRGRFDAIAGVPRSGMTVATLMALRMGLPLYSADPSGLVRLSTGHRLRYREDDVRRVLIMEDSSASGTSIKEAKRWLAGDDRELTWGAIYTTSAAMPGLDLWHRRLELPHWFEWNFWGNSHLLKGLLIGTDMDGILCPDFTAEEDDDGFRYIDRLRTTPTLIPGDVHVGTIITARLEKYRGLTEAWLASNRITFDKLVMGPWATKREREGQCIGTWKAAQCDAAGVGTFVESCPTQARVIADRRPHPVICPAMGESIMQ